jgi:hypothetical protein
MKNPFVSLASLRKKEGFWQEFKRWFIFYPLARGLNPYLIEPDNPNDLPYYQYLYQYLIKILDRNSLGAGFSECISLPIGILSHHPEFSHLKV